jgi:hypothetical protein
MLFNVATQLLYAAVWISVIAVGFVQLARETSVWMENHRAGKE